LTITDFVNDVGVVPKRNCKLVVEIECTGKERFGFWRIVNCTSCDYIYFTNLNEYYEFDSLTPNKVYCNYFGNTIDQNIQIWFDGYNRYPDSSFQFYQRTSGNKEHRSNILSKQTESTFTAKSFSLTSLVFTTQENYINDVFLSYLTDRRDTTNEIIYQNYFEGAKGDTRFIHRSVKYFDSFHCPEVEFITPTYYQ
jgi:hypothetical protein